MYERLNKSNNRMNIGNNYFNTRLSLLKYRNNLVKNKKVNCLFDTRLKNIYNNKYKLDSILNKTRSNMSHISYKNIFPTNNNAIYRKNNISMNNNKISKIISDLRKEITIKKSNYDFKIFDYKNKKRDIIPKKSNLLLLKNERNNSFAYKQYSIGNNLIKNNNKTPYIRNTNKIHHNYTFSNNNFNITQNNTNNFFFLNYNHNKTPKKYFIYNSIIDSNKKSEENSIDINNLDNSSILNS